MLTVLSVLRSGGLYDAEWVERLQKAVRRHLSVPHEFACLSDVDVPCKRIPLVHDWPKWWAKVEIFRPGVVSGPTLYLDLDTVIVGSIDKLASFEHDFAIMRNLNASWMPGSAVMWFRDKAPAHIYEQFAESPESIMAQYADPSQGCYIGDQAWIWDAMDRKIPFLTDKVPGLVRSYRRHCAAGVPEGCSVVAFGGSKKPSNAPEAWVREAWAV